MNKNRWILIAVLVAVVVVVVIIGLVLLAVWFGGHRAMGPGMMGGRGGLLHGWHSPLRGGVMAFRPRAFVRPIVMAFLVLVPLGLLALLVAVVVWLVRNMPTSAPPQSPAPPAPSA